MIKNVRIWLVIITTIFCVIFITSIIDSTYNFIDGNIKSFIDSFFEDGLFVYKLVFLSNSLTISLLAYTQKVSNKISSSENPLYFELNSDLTFLKIGLIAGLLNLLYIGIEIYGIKTIGNPELGLIVFSLIFLVVYILYAVKFFRRKYYFFKISETGISFSLKGSVRKISLEDIQFLSMTNKGFDINLFNKDLESISYECYNLNESEIEILTTIVIAFNNKYAEIENKETTDDFILTNDDFTENSISANNIYPTIKYGFKSTKIQISFDLNTSENNYVDYDICCFILNSEGKLINEECFVFYNNLISPNEFVENRGDKSNKEPFCFQYFIDFINSLPACQSILFYFVVHTEESFPLSEFKITIENRLDLSEFMEISHQISTNNENSIRLFKFEKDNNNWIMTVLFENSRQTLEQIVDKYY